MILNFLNGAFLAGLSLVSIPIIIHLLQRKRFRVVHWGAMEFLKLSQRNRSRRLLIEQLLLLLLRCLIIALVVLAVSRPVARASSAGLMQARGSVHAIILLDNSYSMGYAPAGRSGSEWTRAVKRAHDLVARGLRQGDSVSVVLASDPPRAVIRKPTLDLKSAVAAIDRLTLSDQTTNYGKAARMALEIAGESSSINREIFLIGDCQASGWEGKGKDTAAWEALCKLGRVMFLPVRDPSPASNGAVEWVQAARGLATARSAARIQARIVNYGRQPMRNVLATLEIDGKSTDSAQRVDIDPGQGALVTFSHLFDRPGVHRCTVRIPEDNLPADDRAYLGLRVRESVRILIVNGKPNISNPQKDAGFFLNLALAPPGDRGAEPAAIEPRTVIGAGGLGSANLPDYDVVVLSDVNAVQDRDRRNLAEFVQNGGGLVFFLGSRTDPALFNRDLLQASPSLSPARIGMQVPDQAFLDPATFDHPALQRFKSAQDVDVSTALFRRHYRLEPAEGDRTVRVMGRFTTGDPAMVEKTFGLGRVILVPSTADLEWNDLPARPFFLPMLHQLVAYLASGTDGTRNGLVGQTLIRPIPLAEAGRKTTLTDPRGALTVIRPIVDDRGAVVSLEDPSHAGFYSLQIEDGTKDAFAVNRDTAESDLRVRGESALRREMPFPGWEWVDANEDMLSALSRSRQGVELWRHCLIAALCLMLAETMLAQLFGRRA